MKKAGAAVIVVLEMNGGLVFCGACFCARENSQLPPACGRIARLGAA
jgi:hypothetical protein